ncbi:hypothetical protein [Robertmurraya sp. Marseille-Q9965]
MKKLVLKSVLVLGILGLVAVGTVSTGVDLAGYPVLHSVDPGFTTLGYPVLH